MLQSMTIELPLATYRHLEQLAQRQQRSIPETVERLVAPTEQTINDEEGLSAELIWELDQLVQFSDDELWEVGKMRATPYDETTMEELLGKRQSAEWDANDQVSAEKLSSKFNRIMLMRAKAAALLKERGYDVTPLLI